MLGLCIIIPRESLKQKQKTHVANIQIKISKSHIIQTNAEKLNRM